MFRMSRGRAATSPLITLHQRWLSPISSGVRGLNQAEIQPTGAIEDLSPMLEASAATEALELLTTRNDERMSSIVAKAEEYGRALALPKVLRDVGVDAEADRPEHRAKKAWSDVRELDDEFFSKGRGEMSTRFLTRIAGTLRMAARPEGGS